MLNDQMVVFAKYCLILGQELRGDWKIICYHSTQARCDMPPIRRIKTYILPA
jgi:hypothetical protein